MSPLKEYIVQYIFLYIIWKAYLLALIWDYVSLSICNSNREMTNIVTWGRSADFVEHGPLVAIYRYRLYTAPDFVYM